MSTPMAPGAAFNSSIRSTDAQVTRVLSAGRRSGGSWWGSAGHTTVRSASEAEDLVGNLDHGFHRGHIVDADYVRAAQDRGGDGGRGGAFQQLFGGLIGLRQKRFARCAH